MGSESSKPKKQGSVSHSSQIKPWISSDDQDVILQKVLQLTGTSKYVTTQQLHVSLFS